MFTLCHGPNISESIKAFLYSIDDALDNVEGGDASAYLSHSRPWLDRHFLPSTSWHTLIYSEEDRCINWEHCSCVHTSFLFGCGDEPTQLWVGLHRCNEISNTFCFVGAWLCGLDLHDLAWTIEVCWSLLCGLDLHYLAWTIEVWFYLLLMSREICILTSNSLDLVEDIQIHNRSGKI